MFFIIGLSQKEVQLDFHQMEVCHGCGKYGKVEVWMVYSYLMFFFIPIFKWGKRYFVKMDCCGVVSELDTQVGKAIEKGAITTLDTDTLSFGSTQYRKGGTRCCSHCGYTTEEDFQFCPKCGKEL